MAYNVFKPNGASSASKPDAGGAVVKSVPVFGVVKDNIDTVRSGRLRVYVSDMGGSNPDDSTTWVTVNYMSPYFGSTQGSGDKTGFGTYLQNPTSYGMWNSPPDVGTTVICLFVNGDPNYGYWIGCVPEPESLFMVPAIGSSETVVLNSGESDSYGGATRLPVTNINANNNKVDSSVEFWNQPKPVHSYLAGVLNQQGLIRDPIRGPISTSAQRESPSRVGWGVSSPGRPIYEGGFDDATITDNLKSDKSAQLKVISRRVGHSIVMDDGDISGKDQLIRMRSSLGHQILMSDDGQCLFIIHANGQSWIELGKEGTIDMYATNSVNIRTQGDLNLHADNNVNIHAKKDFNIYGENINVNADKKMNLRVGADLAIEALGTLGISATGAATLKSGADVGLVAGGAAFLSGSKINLNSGSPSFSPAKVSPIPLVAHTDTLFDKSKGWAAAPGSLFSITSRAPAHSPWASANQGVDVKVNNDADANFPSAPSPAVAKAAADTPASPPVPVKAAAAATVPSVAAVSGALDKNTTATMISQVSTMAETGPAKAAISSGLGIVGAGTAAVAAIGKMAQTPSQLESAGVIKPGSASLVDSLISKGKSLTQALTNNLFTGKPGASNITSYLSNTAAQAATQVVNFQKSQSALTATGLITGKEAPSQIAGLVVAGASAGITATVNFVKNLGTGTGSSLPSISSLTGSASKMLGSIGDNISAGKFAANMSATLTGGLSGLSTSLSGLGNSVSGLLDNAKGVAGSAFAAITKNFPKLESGKPQDLKKISEKAVADAQSSGSPLGDLAKTASSALSTAGTSLSGIASGLSSSPLGNGLLKAAGVNAALLPSQLKTIGSVASGASKLISKIPTGTSSELTGASAIAKAEAGVAASVNATSNSAISSGLSGLPGAGNAAASIVNNAKGATTSIPGASSISGAISSLSASIGTGISTGADKLLTQLKTPGSTLQGIMAAGLPPSALSQLNSAISALSAGGASPVKIPTIATNTTDRSSVSSQLSSVLGSPKIPAPNYSGIVVPQSETNKAREVSKKELLALIDMQQATVLKIKDEYQTAIDTLPPGDPGIVAQREKYYAEKKIWADLLNQLTNA